jgi:hypothetical protein
MRTADECRKLVTVYKNEAEAGVKQWHHPMTTITSTIW